MDERVLAGSPQDLRWQPGVVPGMELPRKEAEPEPAIEPEPAEELEGLAVPPSQLSEAPMEAPETQAPEPEPIPKPSKATAEPAENTPPELSLPK
jgi:hypothetical protein